METVTAASYVIPTDAPESDGTLSWDSTGMIIVRVLADGEQGLGWSYGSPVAAGLIRDALASLVAGANAMDVQRAAEAMTRAVRNIGREGIASIAISAVDIALWDLKARLLGVPLAALIGQVRPDVPIYGSGGFICYDEKQTRDQLAGWVHGDRIPRVKIKVGESWGGNERRDRERVALARKVIGPDTELYVDANGGYGTGQAVRVGAWLCDYGVSWFEEPRVEPESCRPRRDQGAGRAGCGGRRVQLDPGRLGAPARRRRGRLPAAREIGDQLGISQMHVSRLLAHALGYLRDRILESRPRLAVDLEPADS